MYTGYHDIHRCFEETLGRGTPILETSASFSVKYLKFVVLQCPVLWGWREICPHDETKDSPNTFLRRRRTPLNT